FSPDTFPDKQHTKAELIGDLLTRLQKSRPVYIGDSVGDVEAAQSNGITSVAVTYGDGDVAKLLRAKPDYVADNAQELAQILYSTN
ncbi:MAG: HAD family hydrolase, partial [Oscillospiraceae bacterium]